MHCRGCHAPRQESPGRDRLHDRGHVTKPLVTLIAFVLCRGERLAVAVLTRTQGRRGALANPRGADVFTVVSATRIQTIRERPFSSPSGCFIPSCETEPILSELPPFRARRDSLFADQGRRARGCSKRASCKTFTEHGHEGPWPSRPAENGPLTKMEGRALSRPRRFCKSLGIYCRYKALANQSRITGRFPLPGPDEGGGSSC